MLLQIEILVRITSILCLIGIPIIILVQHIIHKKQTQETEEEIQDQNNIQQTQETEEEIQDQDPTEALIATMLASEGDQETTIETSNQDTLLNDETIPGEPGEHVVEGEEDNSTIITTITSTQIEEIEIDIDNDGIIDDTIILQTQTTQTLSSSEVNEIKRQKALEIIQYELRTLKDKDNGAEYEKKLIEARAIYPERDDFTLMLGDYYFNQENYKKALGLFRKIVDNNKNDDKSLFMMANCYIKTNERENAQIILEKLTHNKPENPKYRMSLAEVYYHNKDITQTIECVRMMVKLRPTNMDYLSTLAQLYHEIGENELYTQTLYRMLELDPLNHEIKSEIQKYSIK